MSKLTERDKWLMERAWETAKSFSVVSLSDWLSHGMVHKGVEETVESFLARQASRVEELSAFVEEGEGSQDPHRLLRHRAGGHMSENTERLRALIQEYALLDEKLGEVKRDIKATKLKLAEEVLGLKVGCLVDTAKGLMRVCCVEVAGWDPLTEQASYNRPHLFANPRKKDGTWGKVERRVYGKWKVVEGGD